MAGRPRKSAAVKIAQGNPGRRKIAETVQAKAGCPDCPTVVSRDKDAKAMWDWLVTNLDSMGILTLADRLVLELIANDYSELQQALRLVKKEGMILRGEKGGSYSHPALNIAASARKRIHFVMQNLGLTPKAREQLNLQLAEVRKSALADFRDRRKPKQGATK